MNMNQNKDFSGNKKEPSCTKKSNFIPPSSNFSSLSRGNSMKRMKTFCSNSKPNGLPASSAQNSKIKKYGGGGGSSTKASSMNIYQTMNARKESVPKAQKKCYNLDTIIFTDSISK